MQAEAEPAIDHTDIARRDAALRDEAPKLTSTAATPVKPMTAQLDQGVPRQAKEGLAMLLPMTAPNATTQPTPISAPSQLPARLPAKQTLAGLGERLAWIRNLAAELPASASGNPLAETAALGESMVVLALYQCLAGLNRDQ